MTIIYARGKGYTTYTTYTPYTINAYYTAYRGYTMNAITTPYTTSIQPGAQITEDLLDSFTRFIDASPQSVRTYSRAIKQFLQYLSLNGITQPVREDVISFRDSLKETHKPTTIQNYIIAIRLFFQWTETAGIYPNVAQHIKGAKVSRSHKRDYLTSAQLKNVLQGIDRSTEQGRRDYALVSLMIVGGLRDIEASRANVEDLRNLGDNVVLYLQGKGRDERQDFVIIPADVEKAIRASLADRKGIDGKSPLFVSLSNNSRGQRISTRSVSGAVKASFKRAGYDSERLTAHTLRHSAVTLAVLGGNSVQDVQQFARHADISTTMIYFHEQDKTQNKCSNTIASAIF